MIKFLRLTFLTLASMLIISCSSNDDEIEYDYLPVKLVGSEMWSILNVQTGEVVFRDEFKNEPSAIYNDVFLVKNDKGTFDYYNVNDVKKPVNKTSYYMAADFVGSDIVPATLPGKQITLINNKCEEVAVLDKSIERCAKFVEGLAPFMDDNDKWGFLDKTGKIIIKAKYDNVSFFNDGVSICSITDMAKDLTTYYAIDNTGKELFTFTSKDYKAIGTYSDGYLPVVKGEEIIYLDNTGKKAYSLCNLTDSAYYKVNLCTYKDSRSVFCEGDVFGIKDKDNNIILRAKYDLLYCFGEGRYLAEKEDKYGIIDFNDNVLLDFKYDEITQLRKEIFLVGNEKSKTLINDKGEDITNVNFTQYSLTQINVVKNNYLDPKAYAQKIINSFTDTTCDGYNGNMTLRNFSSELTYSASYYSDESTLIVNNENTGRQVGLMFNNYLSKQTYKYETYYYWTYRYPAGYVFNYGAKLRGVWMTYDISEYECLEEKISAEFDKNLRSRGYKEIEGGYWKSPKGTAVGLSYDEGIITLIYYFTEGNYIDLTRNPRKSNNKRTPEGKDYVSAVDTVVVDTIAADTAVYY